MTPCRRESSNKPDLGSHDGGRPEELPIPKWNENEEKRRGDFACGEYRESKDWEEEGAKLPLSSVGGLVRSGLQSSAWRATIRTRRTVCELV